MSTSTHSFHLHQEPFEKIKKGSKTVESRLYDAKRKQILKGDTIIFTSRTTGESIMKTVIDLQVSPSFHTLLQSIPFTHFASTSPEEELAGLAQYYAKEDEEKYGVVAILFE